MIFRVYCYKYLHPYNYDLPPKPIGCNPQLNNA